MAAKKKGTVRSTWRTYADRATQYARDAASGTPHSSRYVRLAAQRHLDDLVRSRTDEFEYKFDKVAAGKACAFIERLPHVKGEWARYSELLHLEPWELFIVCSIFGWVDKKTGYRRFTEADIFVPRKNGKTILAAAIGLYMLLADGEPGAEVYCGASKESQAHEVFSPASKMARRAPGLKEWYGLTIAKKSLYLIDEGSKFEPVIGSPGDGPSPHCYIHDEYHEQATDAQYASAKTGMMARSQPLQLIITTAGVDIESPCHELQEVGKKILDGTIPNDSVFVIIFTVDDPDRLVKVGDREVPYWTTIEAAREANPNFGVSVLERNIRAALQSAIQQASKQNSYKIKHLNIWVNARAAWMNMERWRACKDESLQLEDFVHEPCYEGLDLGARIDLTSRCKIFVRLGSDGLKHYYLFAKHYVPLDRANDGEHQHYGRWIKGGHIIGHPGAEIQLPMVQAEVEADTQIYNYARISFDPHQALQMQQELKLRMGQDAAAEDIVIEVPQRWQYFSPAMQEIEAAVLSKRLHHTGDPVLAWAIGNVMVKPDANDNIFPRKENSVSKIDPATAFFTGFYPALAADPVAAGPIEVW